jgi:hypothetical protein
VAEGTNVSRLKTLKCRTFRLRAFVAIYSPVYSPKSAVGFDSLNSYFQLCAIKFALSDQGSRGDEAGVGLSSRPGVASIAHCAVVVARFWAVDVAAESSLVVAIDDVSLERTIGGVCTGSMMTVRVLVEVRPFWSVTT